MLCVKALAAKATRTLLTTMSHLSLHPSSQNQTAPVDDPASLYLLPLYQSLYQLGFVPFTARYLVSLLYYASSLKSIFVRVSMSVIKIVLVFSPIRARGCTAVTDVGCDRQWLAHAKITDYRSEHMAGTIN